jgi:hypothetical protein
MTEPIEPPFLPDEPLLPVLDELPRRMQAGASEDEVVWDLHDLLDREPPSEDDLRHGNMLGKVIDVEDDWDSGVAGASGLRTAAPSSTMAAAQELATALRDFGMKVSIELRTDAQGSWRVCDFVRNLQHHTVSRPSNGMTPCLSLVKYGRSDLSGPLANGYLGYDGIARIITMGYANHPGLGGPWSVAGHGTVPRDNGRPYIFGWEHEGGYPESWTGPYEKMHDWMARCGAAVLQWRGLPLTCSGEHKTWAGARKIDRLNYTTESGRDAIAVVQRTPEDDVTDQDKQDIIKGVVAELRRADFSPAEGTQPLDDMVSQVHRGLTQPVPRQDPTAGMPEGQTAQDISRFSSLDYMDARLRRIEAILTQPPA